MLLVHIAFIFQCFYHPLIEGKSLPVPLFLVGEMHLRVPLIQQISFDYLYVD